MSVKSVYIYIVTIYGKIPGIHGNNYSSSPKVSLKRTKWKPWRSPIQGIKSDVYSGRDRRNRPRVDEIEFGASLRTLAVQGLKNYDGQMFFLVALSIVKGILDKSSISWLPHPRDIGSL